MIYPKRKLIRMSVKTSFFVLHVTKLLEHHNENTIVSPIIMTLEEKVFLGGISYQSDHEDAILQLMTLKNKQKLKLKMYRPAGDEEVMYVIGITQGCKPSLQLSNAEKHEMNLELS